MPPRAPTPKPPPKTPPAQRGGPAAALSGPPDQTCAKCGAVFRWKPLDPKNKASPMTAHLVKSMEKCDCGYGTGAPVFEDE
jgi:hypothetical protein